MTEGSGLGPSISDIVQTRPWKHALLTTYTLSLSYFESEVLRALLRRGCSDIWLVVDAEGYRTSLLERRSMRVGQEYRLIPVALPDGVFHAKCIYLSGDEGDLLLVGSGNVTFHGHGRNSEVFEALTPGTAATAFRDFADFLEAVGSRPDIRIARSEWVSDFAARARLAADRGADEEGVPPLRLIHPTNDAVLKQLPGLLAPYGPCSEAVVMSPYHDPDGLALREMVSSLGLSRVSVAVTKTDESPFPFELAAAWPQPVEAVRPLRKDKRFVHAKWYEFQTEARKLLLTGSINATRQALMTTDNAEIGVLRPLPPGTAPLEWEAAERPAFVPDQRLPSGLKGNEIVYAWFDHQDSSMLSGRIISLQPTAGTWRGRLIQADGDAISFETSVEADGAFSVRSNSLEAFSELPALQIIMTLAEREARGWVHNEMLLSISGRRRLTAGALSRLMRREGTDDDIEALLDYLSISAEHHLRMFDRPIAKAGEREEDQDKTKAVTVDLADLKPGAVEPKSTTGSHDVSSTSDQFDLAMMRLRRVLLGHGRARSAMLQRAGDSTLAEEDDPSSKGEGPSPEKDARRLGLNDFEREIGRLIKDAEGKQDIVRGLLAMELEVVMWMRIHRLNDPDGAHEFLRAWFARACGIAKPDSTRLTSLQQHIVTAAAVLFRLGAGPRTAGELHDSLERYFGGAVDREQATRSLFPDVDAGFAGLLTDSSQEELEAALLAVLAERTTRQQLVDALALAAKRQPIPKDWQVFGMQAGAELHAALSDADWKDRVAVAYRPDVLACAFKYHSFSSSVAAAYRRSRFVQCIYCDRFTVNVHP
jgi:hypothetical protein